MIEASWLPPRDVEADTCTAHGDKTCKRLRSLNVAPDNYYFIPDWLDDVTYCGAFQTGVALSHNVRARASIRLPVGRESRITHPWRRNCSLVPTLLMQNVRTIIR